jgi:hypothetical protein
MLNLFFCFFVELPKKYFSIVKANYNHSLYKAKLLKVDEKPIFAKECIIEASLWVTITFPVPFQTWLYHKCLYCQSNKEIYINQKYKYLHKK